MIFRGGCHCGAISVELESARPAAELPLRDCQCRFCRKHGARNTVDRAGRLRIVAEPAALARYRFALGTADFFLCRRCGVYVAAVIDDAFATVNVRVLDDAAAFTGAVRAVDYGGENDEGRRARRRAEWTPTTVELRT